ncbi:MULTISPECIES: anti-sigma factor [unclassified Bacillus (in: firmicutes)]|uniref:anti-sigma factor n=1 Tax=unclassified Bacillus (in: firmicutes) TaxID=185979 RepID=UPI0021D52759|nr:MULTISPECIES: anti-sigma factor [unclassified Bacillus (in: firmicutes)]
MIEHNGKKELVVSADGLKGQLDSSAVYQVWLFKGDQPVPAGALKQITKEKELSPMRYLKKKRANHRIPWQSPLNQKRITSCRKDLSY